MIHILSDIHLSVYVERLLSPAAHNELHAAHYIIGLTGARRRVTTPRMGTRLDSPGIQFLLLFCHDLIRAEGKKRTQSLYLAL